MFVLVREHIWRQHMAKLLGWKGQQTESDRRQTATSRFHGRKDVSVVEFQQASIDSCESAKPLDNQSAQR